MAKVISDIGLTGQIGGVIYYRYKGVLMARSRPYRYKDKKSNLQIEVRNKFSNLVGFANKALDFVQKGIWNHNSVGLSACNLFVKLNSPCFNRSGKISRFDQLLFSIGRTPLPHNLRIVLANEGNCKVTVTWDYNEKRQKNHGDDRLRVYAFCGDAEVRQYELGVVRRDLVATFQVPCNTDCPIYLYVWFFNPATLEGSPTFFWTNTVSGTPDNLGS